MSGIKQVKKEKQRKIQRTGKQWKLCLQIQLATQRAHTENNPEHCTN
jgi:hypothetical protein